MLGARIGGALDCSGTTITNQSGPTVYGEHLQVAGNVLLREGFTAEGTGDLGTVRLAQARIDGHLECSGATITNPTGPALHGEHLHVAATAFLNQGFTADGTGKRGTVRLHGARIEGNLNCSDAIIHNPAGPAIQAGGALQVVGRVFLHRAIAHGAGEWGTIWMGGARIGGQLDCSGASITNPSGPALRADFLHAAGLFLRERFTADGASELGTVRLLGARITVHLDCSDAVVTSRSDPHHRWTLDGLTYAGLPLDPCGVPEAGQLC
jgi:hypothetical protein